MSTIKIRCSGSRKSGPHKPRLIETFSNDSGTWRIADIRTPKNPGGTRLGQQGWEYLHGNDVFTQREIGSLMNRGLGDEVRRRYSLPACPACRLSVPATHERITEILDNAATAGVTSLNLKDLAVRM